MSREKIAGDIDDVDLLQQVDDCICTVISGVLKPDVEVPNNRGGAVCGARLSCHSEIIHPCRTAGRDVDVDPHEVESLVARGKLEGHQVRGQGPYGLVLKSVVVLPPDEAYSSLVWAGRFQNKYYIPREILSINCW